MVVVVVVVVVVFLRVRRCVLWDGVNGCGHDVLLVDALSRSWGVGLLVGGYMYTVHNFSWGGADGRMDRHRHHDMTTHIRFTLLTA